jgi:general L-amino acid transport system permease protein
MRFGAFLRTRLFGSPFNVLVTCLGLVVLGYLFVGAINWAVIESIWRKEDAALCKQVNGACWAVIHARHRLILFGLYPYEEHWRSALACAVAISFIVLSCLPLFWTPLRLVAIWLTGFGTFYALMDGGVLGLLVVPTDNWGGLALTIFVYITVIVIGMPLSVVLALARRSPLPAISWMASVAIDVTRSLPLLTILFTAVVIFPLALPDWLQAGKLYRVITAFAFFFACYQAENLRGGLQGVPQGQEEAAKALGLRRRQIIGLILLPQAFRAALPSTINQMVVTFKDTSVIIIIGFFDVLASGRAAYGSGEWSHAYVEVSLFLAAIYFIFVFTLSRYGAYLERRMRVDKS